jgi:hypothetical protein
MRIGSAGIGTLLLCAANLALLFNLLWLLASGSSVGRISSASATAAEPVAVDLNLPATSVNLDAIVAAPLFHPSRTVFKALDAAETSAQLAPPDYRIVGTIAFPKQPLAVILIHNQTGARSKVQEGDVLEGWTIDAVASQQVLLSLNGRQTQIGVSKNATTASGPNGIAASFSIVPTPTGSVPTASEPTGSAPASIRVLSDGRARNTPTNATNTTTASQPGNGGARLYRPPPG